MCAPIPALRRGDQQEEKEGEEEQAIRWPATFGGRFEPKVGPPGADLGRNLAPKKFALAYENFSGSVGPPQAAPRKPPGGYSSSLNKAPNPCWAPQTPSGSSQSGPGKENVPPDLFRTLRPWPADSWPSQARPRQDKPGQAPPNLRID